MPFGFFGVYDGHGGDKASAYVCNNLHMLFLEQASKLSGPISESQWMECLRLAFLKVEGNWLAHAETVRA